MSSDGTAGDTIPIHSLGIIESPDGSWLPAGHYHGDGHDHSLPEYQPSSPSDDASSVPVARFQIRNRWSNTSTDGFIGSTQGNPATLTWGIVPDGTPINGFGGVNDTSGLIAFFDARIGNAGDSSITEVQQKSWFSTVESAYERWEEISGLTFTYEPNDDGRALATASGVQGVRADLRLGGASVDGQSGGNTLAFNAFPNNGDGVIDTDNTNFYGNSSNNFRALRNVIAHEVGHGIGFSHVESSNAGFLMEPTINTGFDGPQLDDILAAQRNYGDALEKNGGNNTASTATPLGSISAGARLSFGLDATNTFVAPGDVDFVSIDDNSDFDFFEFTLTSPQRVNLSVAPQGPTYNEGSQGGTQSPFETRRQADLALTLFDANQNVIEISNDAGLGGTEFISNAALEPGTYLARVATQDNAAQFYRFDLKTEAEDRVFLVDEDFTSPGEPGDPTGPGPQLVVVGDLPVEDTEFTLTADPNGFIGVAEQGFLAEGDALVSHRVGDNGAGNVTNFIEFSVDATGLEDIELELVAYQHPGTYEGTENLLIEVDTGGGFVALLQDFEVWNGENDLAGEGSGGIDGNTTPTSTGALSVLDADNSVFDVRIAITSGFFSNGGTTPSSNSEAYYIDSLFVTGEIITVAIPEPHSVILLTAATTAVFHRRRTT